MATLYCIHCGEAFESSDPESVFCPEHGGKINENASTEQPSPPASSIESLFKTARKPDEPFQDPGGKQILTVEENARQGGWNGRSLKTYAKGEVLLGLYRIDEIRGGSMGHVYIAEHLQRGVKLAIKSPNEGMLLNDAFFSMVLKEADAWTDLGLHPNIAYCYYVRQLDGIPHIFIEYVDGGNLQEWIGEVRCYDLKVGLDLAIQFCHGMGYAHSKGKIHRDIKPENILMTANGTLKVTDFGLIKSDVPSVGGCHVGRGGTNLAQMGTLAYMSPEQCEDPKNVDERTDIYAFGVCMYEMFCGRRPYEQTSDKLAASYFAKLDQKTAPEPIALRPDIPKSFSEILKKSIALRKEKRYSSLQDLRKDLSAVYRELFHEDAPHAEIDLPDLRADALNNRAVSYLDLSREDEAIACWEEALKIDAVHFESTYNYYYLMFEKMRMPWFEFKAKLEALEKNVGHRADYWAILAQQCLYMGDLEAVEKIQRSPHKQENSEFIDALKKEKKRLIRSFIVSSSHSLRKEIPNLPVYQIHSIAITLDGRYAVSGNYDHTLELWDLATGQDMKTFIGHNFCVTSVAITPDGRYALSGSEDWTLKLWDLSTGQEMKTFTGHNSDVSSVAVTPDGRYAISGSRDHTLKLWDLLTGGEEKTFVGHKHCVWAVAITPDGRYALSGSEDKTLKLWELSTGKEIRTIYTGQSAVISVAITPDGRYAVSGNSDRTLKLWDLATGQDIITFTGHIYPITSVAITPNGRYALSGCIDNTLKIWELSTGQEIRTLTGHKGAVRCVAITPDGRYALSGGYEQALRLWDISAVNLKIKTPYPLLSEIAVTSTMIQTYKKTHELLEKAQLEVGCFHFNKAIQILREAQTLSGFERDSEILNVLNAIRIKQKSIVKGLINGWCKFTFTGHRGAIWSVAITPDDQYVLSGSHDNTLKIWELSTGQEIRTFTGHEGGVKTVVVTPDGRYILSGSEDKTMKLWELSTGQEKRTFRGHKKGVDLIAFTLDGQVVLSVSFDMKVKFWELSTGREVEDFAEHESAINYQAIKPYAKYDFQINNNTLNLFNAENHQKVGTFTMHNCGSSKAFTLDGRYALSDNGYDLVLSDQSPYQEIRTFTGHTGIVNSIAFTQDGRYAISGSGDDTLKLWEFDWDFDVVDEEK